jgi:hypothetical protein
LVPVRKAFSSALLVPVATTETNGRYRPGAMVFFPPVLLWMDCHVLRRMAARMHVSADRGAPRIHAELLNGGACLISLLLISYSRRDYLERT